MPSQCQRIKQEYENLKDLRKRFNLEFEKAAKTGNLKKAKKLKAEIESKRDALYEKLWPFERISPKELKEQYESQRDILKNNGILETLSNGELGIRGIDDKEYTFPDYSETIRRMIESYEKLKTKTEQGFNQLLIVPFGMKLDDLIERYKQVILRHYREGKLFATKEKPSDPDTPLELNEDEPVWVWDQYPNADISGELVYFPKKFSFNHQGKTKKEILKKQGGFNFLLIEDLPNIPRKGKGKEIKGRKQLEAAGKTPNQYLEMMKTEPQYKDETGMTPEQTIIYALIHLEQTNQVIDDFQSSGSASYQLGAYFPAHDCLPCVYWTRFRRQTCMGGDNPLSPDSTAGARGAVMF